MVTIICGGRRRRGASIHHTRHHVIHLNAEANAATGNRSCPLDGWRHRLHHNKRILYIHTFFSRFQVFGMTLYPLHKTPCILIKDNSINQFIPLIVSGHESNFQKLSVLGVASWSVGVCHWCRQEVSHGRLTLINLINYLFLFFWGGESHHMTLKLLTMKIFYWNASMVVFCSALLWWLWFTVISGL